MSTPSHGDVGVALFVDRFAHTPERKRAFFLWLDKAFNRLGVTPTRLAGGGDFKTYRGLRPRLLRSEFSEIVHFAIECLPPGREEFRGWKSQAAVGRNRRMFRDHDGIWHSNWMPDKLDEVRWTAKWIVFAEDAGLPEGVVLEEMMRFAELAMDEYGYIAWLKRGTEPAAFDMNLMVPGDRLGETWSHSRDQLWNRFTWTRFGCWTKRLLRDTFPINFLGRSYLDLPIEGTTLERWILADPARGTLEPFNGRVWVWRPVIEQIPFIREPLFRAGLLHWWGMFSVDDYTQLQVKEPFVPPAQTPEMFRPEYFVGRDPKITN